MNDCQLTATFPDARRAAIARDQLPPAVRGVATLSEPELPKETRGEARFMGKIVAVVVLASAFGTAFGVGMGALIAYLFGPHGTSGYIIQMVSWAIFAHLLIGMWAGYALLADRSGRELRHSGPVTLTILCAKIDATALAERLRALGATSVEIRDGAASPAPG